MNNNIMNNNIMNNNIMNNEIMIGGKAVEMGGMGCLFVPNLKCINHKRVDAKKNKISKLMLQENAIMEMDVIKAILPIVKNIPGYKKHFLLDDITLCQPDILSKDDLKHFDRICGNLTEEDITSKNIKQAMDDLLIINMPYGGIDLYRYLNEGNNKVKLQKIYDINAKYIKIIEKVVLPMNKLNIYHNDIKSNNFLIDSKKNVKLIDWGISFIDNKKFPDIISRQPLYFPHPLSAIIFSDIFQEHYNYFIYKQRYGLTNSSTENVEKQIEEFLNDFVYFFINENAYSNLVKVFVKIFSTVKSFSKDDLKKELIDVLLNVCIKWTNFKNFEFDYEGYYNKIYKKNVDIYSIVLCYIDFITILDQHIKHNKNNKNQTELRNKIETIILKYFHLAPHTAIDTKILIKELRELNKCKQSTYRGKPKSLKKRHPSNKKTKKLKNIKNI